MRATLTRPTRPTLAQRARAAVNTLTKAPEPASVTRLRQILTPTEQPPTATQVRAIVDGLLTCTSLPDVAAAAQLPPGRVLTIIGQLGTFLRHTRDVPAFTLVKAKDVTAARLFQVEPGQGALEVVIPTGFERSGSGERRDISKALGTIVASRPTDTEIARWVARQQPADYGLEYTVVTMVWFFARIGRLDELDEINPGHVPLARSLVAAWDLLDGGRRRALAAVVAMAETETVTEAHIDAVRPFWEARTSRLQQAMHFGGQAVAREARSFVEHALTNLPGDVQTINQGQIRRLCEASNLVVDVVSRAEESDIRSRLDEMGLGADADLLVHEGVSALKRGLDVEFWQAMELRAQGDPDWHAPLEVD